MMTNNKILTVSYGTFSCTLEGFDDSVETMKAVAEYFREIAAKDRLFGVEPMDIDPEELAAIAQEQAARPVNGLEEDGHIVLDATSETPDNSATAAAAIAGVAATTALTADSDIVPTVPDADVKAFFKDSTADDLPEDIITDTDDTPVVDNLHHIRAAISDIADQTEDDDTDEGDVAEMVADPEEDIEDELTTDGIQEAAALDEATEEEADDDLKAALAAIVDEDEEDADDEVLSVEASDEDQEEEEEDVLSALLGDLGDPEDAYEEDILTAADSEEDAEDEDEELSDLSALVLENAISEDEEDDSFDDEEVNAFFDDDDDSDEDDDDDILNALTDDDDDVEDEPLILTEALKPAQEDSTEPDPQTMKLKRADLEAAIERANQADAENSDSDDDAVDAAVAATTEKTSRKPGRRVMDEIANDRSSSVSRLLELTEDQMGEPEGTTRRDAFAQLKAAVAAKKADKGTDDLGDLVDDDETGDDPYRADLADSEPAARPERRKSKTTTPERPEVKQPAPLKLVTDQEAEETATDAPQEAAPAASSNAPSFADFAVDMGADTDLPHLLEAAASYLTFVEGRKDFSRPQLMGMVGKLEHFSHSREEGLRCFGKLLRDGKIEKVRGGRFQASKDIGFKPDTRVAG